MEEHEAMVGGQGGGGEEAATSDEAWGAVTESFAALGSSIRSHYQQHGPPGSSDNLRRAAEDLAEAAGRMGRALASAWADPHVQDQARTTLGSLMTAITATLEAVRSDLAEPDGPAA